MFMKSVQLSDVHKHVQGMSKQKQAAAGAAGLMSKDGSTTRRSVHGQIPVLPGGVHL